MKLQSALILVLFSIACPALAQMPAGGMQQKPPVQHQPGTVAKPAEPAPISPHKKKRTRQNWRPSII
jgi:hypothetical protein